jgi:hypothetical protein
VLSTRDANIAWWSREAKLDPEGPQVEAFCQGRDGRFFQEEAYEAHLPALARLWGRMQGQRALALRWLDTGELAPELASHLRIEVEAALSTDPEWIGLSVLYPEQLAFALAICRALREAEAGSPRIPANRPDRWPGPGRRLILGGAALSAIRPEVLLAACPYIDGLVEGEGEASLSALAAGAPPGEIPGLLYQIHSGLGRGPLGRGGSQSPQGLHSEKAVPWPRPDFSGLDLGAYWNPEPVLPLLGSRACPWRRCRFCAHNASFGRRRQKEASLLALEMGALVSQHGARHIYLADQSVEPSSLDALSVALEASGVEVAFHAMMRPTPDITREALLRWSRAGLRWVSWGMESGSQRLLDLVRKGTRADGLLPLFEAASNAGVASLPMLIFGLPGSTDSDAEATFALLEQAWPHLAGMTASAFVLFSGTPFGKRPDRYGLVVDGSEPAVVLGGVTVPSTRLRFHELGGSGELRPPRGPLEVAAWRQRARWLPELPITDRMPVEHLLLWAARRRPVIHVPPLPAPSTPPSSPAPSTPPVPIVPAPLAA